MYPTPPPSQPLRAMTDFVGVVIGSERTRSIFPLLNASPFATLCHQFSSRPSSIFQGSSVIRPVRRNRRLLPPPHVRRSACPRHHRRPHGRRPHRRRSRPCPASATHAAVHASVTMSPPPSPPPLSPPLPSPPPPSPRRPAMSAVLAATTPPNGNRPSRSPDPGVLPAPSPSAFQRVASGHESELLVRRLMSEACRPWRLPCVR